MRERECLIWNFCVTSFFFILERKVYQRFGLKERKTGKTNINLITGISDNKVSLMAGRGHVEVGIDINIVYDNSMSFR